MVEHTATGDDGLLTIAEIARRYKLPESTARFYCKRFRDYLPHVGHGKRRRYRPGVLDIFAVILEEIRKHKNANAVESVLAARFAKNIELDEARPQQQQQESNQVPAALAHLPQGLAQLVEHQGQALSAIAQALTRLADRADEADTLREQLEGSQRRLGELTRELKELRRLQDEAEKIHQQDLDQLRKTLNHLAAQVSAK